MQTWDEKIELAVASAMAEAVPLAMKQVEERVQGSLLVTDLYPELAVASAMAEAVPLAMKQVEERVQARLRALLPGILEELKFDMKTDCLERLVQESRKQRDIDIDWLERFVQKSRKAK